MEPMRQIDWVRLRVELNHNWLQNKYLGCLGGFVARLANPPAHRERIGQFLAVEFMQWGERIDDLRWLIDNFEREMTPAKLLEAGPLAALFPESDRRWLQPVLDTLWRRRQPVTRWVTQARAALNRAHELYLGLSRRLPLPGPGDDHALAAMRSAFEEFNTVCRAFTDALGQFPHGVTW